MAVDIPQIDPVNSATQHMSVLSQLAAMHSTNLRWLVLVGSYVLLMPQLFLEPGVISAVVVLIHALFFAWKLNSIRQDRSILFATIISGLMVYGCCWLLITIQARSTVQSLLLQSPYHLAPLWGEHWAPIRWLALFLVVVLTMLAATKRDHKRVGRLMAMFLFWAILIPASVWNMPWLRMHAARLTSPPVEELLGEMQLNNDANQQSVSAYNDREVVKARVWELFRIACLSSYEPSESWCRDFEKLFDEEGVANSVWKILGSEPEFQHTIDTYLKRKYGLDGEIDSSLAADTLDRLGQGEIHMRNAFLRKRVVELVASHLDRNQLIEKVNGSRGEGIGDGVHFDWFEKQELNPLKPWIYASSFLNRELNSENPTEYNELQSSIGRHRYRENPPTPMPRQLRWIMSRFLRPELERSGMDVLAEMAIPQLEKHHRPLCAGYESDEFLRRSWLWSLGSSQQLGSTQVKESEYAMLFLDSKGGAQWRQENRERMLELARLSIAPPPDEPRIKNRDTSIALGAVISVLSLGRKQKPWAIPQHLDFLFLDYGSQPKSSAAFEFWPQFDVGLEDLEKISEMDRLSMRWNYLAKMWPESNAEMFVDCYMKMSPEARQNCLLGVYRNSVGIPGTLPVSAQLEILRRIREQIKNSSEPWAKGIYREHHRGKTNNELETLDCALAEIDSVEGAKMYLRLRDPTSWKSTRPNEGYERYQRVIYRLSKSDDKYATRDRRWFKDRMIQLVKHRNPDLRLWAVHAIKVRPVPEYIPLLASLQLDTDEGVSKAANDVAAFLDRLRARDMQAK